MKKPKVTSVEIGECSELIIKAFERLVLDKAEDEDFDIAFKFAGVFANGFAKEKLIDASIFWKELAYQFEAHLPEREANWLGKRAIAQAQKYEGFATGDCLKRYVVFSKQEELEDREEREKYVNELKEYAQLLEYRLLNPNNLTATQEWVKPAWVRVYDKLMSVSGSKVLVMRDIRGFCERAEKENRNDLVEFGVVQLLKCADNVINKVVNGEYPDVTLVHSGNMLWDCVLCHFQGSEGKKIMDAWQRTMLVHADFKLSRVEDEIEEINWVREWDPSEITWGAAHSQIVKMVDELQQELEPDHPSSMGFKAVFGKPRVV